MLKPVPAIPGSLEGNWERDLHVSAGRERLGLQRGRHARPG
jgi:hypothetical protein